MAGLINFSQRWSSAHHLLWDNHVSMPLPIIPLPLLRTGEWGKVKERVRERDKLRKQNSGILKIMESCETFTIRSAWGTSLSPELCPELFFFTKILPWVLEHWNCWVVITVRCSFACKTYLIQCEPFVSPAREFSCMCRTFRDVVAALF